MKFSYNLNSIAKIDSRNIVIVKSLNVHNNLKILNK